MMKGILDWQSSAVVNVYDEASLWSAPFVQLLLENIPMTKNASILDVGFGTGVPLIELAQRFGEHSKVYGVDPWTDAVEKTREKIRVFGLDNITIFEQSAASIPLPNQSINLICSNLGINNFDNKDVVLKECHRVLKTDGHLCITTNPIGTFNELLFIFEQVMRTMNLTNGLSELASYIAHRGTAASIEAEFAASDFIKRKIIQRETHMRFSSALALFDHALIRIGFLAGWQSLISKENQSQFFEHVMKLIDMHIEKIGSFSISIPMLYMEFERK